jgi:hypothetical protein
MVDPCCKEVDEWANQTPSIQRCEHGYVMALQQRFNDIPGGQSFAQSAELDPRWANAALLQQGEQAVEDIAMQRVMGGKIGKIIQQVVTAVQKDEEV